LESFKSFVLILQSLHLRECAKELVSGPFKRVPQIINGRPHVVSDHVGKDFLVLVLIPDNLDFFLQALYLLLVVELYLLELVFMDVREKSVLPSLSIA
jgi:hypothetical protein